MMPSHSSSPGTTDPTSPVEHILEQQVIRIKRGRMNSFGFEPAWNAYFDFYLGSKYLEKPLLQMEDVTLHLFLRKNLNDNDPNWQMPSIRAMKRRLGISQDKLEAMIDRLIRANLLKKVSGERKGHVNVKNEYVLSDPIQTLSEFLMVAYAGGFEYKLQEEWKAQWEKALSSIDANLSLDLAQNAANGGVPIFGTPHVPESNTPLVPKNGTHKHTSLNKQTTEKQTETATSQESQTPESTEDIVVVLAQQGFTKKAAQKLAQRAGETEVDVLQKVQYLEYLLHRQPEAVKNPQGWLTAAINEDFGPPEGYKSKDQIEAEQLDREREIAEQVQQRKLFQEQEEEQRRQEEQTRAERLEWLQKKYGTSGREVQLWNSVKAAFQMQLSPAAFMSFVNDTELLSLAEGNALVGIPRVASKDWLEKQLSRQIKQQLQLELRFNGETDAKVDLVVFEVVPKVFA